MKKIVLVIEKAAEKELWGRIEYDDNLIVESARSIEKLQVKMKKLLMDFHDLPAEEIEFDLQYDLTGLFEDKSFLNTSAVAEVIGINKSLMRQYTSGIKFPSYERAKQIETAIHKIGKDLLKVKVAGPSRLRGGNRKETIKKKATL